MKRMIRRPANGSAKTWGLWDLSGQCHLSGVALRRLVTSPNRCFRWRNPDMNPYILQDEERSTLASRCRDIAMAMGPSWMESRVHWEVHVRFGEERQGNSSTTPCLLIHLDVEEILAPRGHHGLGNANGPQLPSVELTGLGILHPGQY